MYKGFWGWSLENIGKGTVETKYNIEYVTDKKTWEKILKTDDCFDLYDLKTFDKISEALMFYMTWFVNENCYDIKLWEQIYVNGEMVLEQMIEPESTTKFCMRDSINREMTNRMRLAERQVKELQDSNILYKEFIRKMKLENMFNEFIKNCRKDD